MRLMVTRIATLSACALAAFLGPAVPAQASVPDVAQAQAGSSVHMSLQCEQGHVLCPEVKDQEQIFGHYVGHDEPSLQFYSKVHGSGNRAQYELTLPTDPTPKAGSSFNFELHPAFWFGMDLCDVNSYPEAVGTCAPDSDKNIQPLATHPGGAFFELQFYPPGWAPAPKGSSCDALMYCVAIASFSVAEDPIHGTILNDTCAAVTGIEYANYAFVTKSGHPHASPNPVNSTTATFTPNKATDLFMNPGDQVVVTFNDTEHGLHLQVADHTTGQVGSMTMSAANGFGMVKYAPNPSTECTNIPYDFHPMYDTSSPQGYITWTTPANVSFTDEIGHFDHCTSVTPDPTNPGFGQCAAPAKEGAAGHRETPEGPPTPTKPFADDNFCFTAAQSTLVRLSGCQGTNTGFDGTPYTNAWADGNPDHAGAFFFSSPRTGDDFNVQYASLEFATDLPAIENLQGCDGLTGANCTLIPLTDDGRPAQMYPFFTSGKRAGECLWSFGTDNPSFTLNDFGRNAQYGTLLPVPFLDFGGGGTSTTFFAAYSSALRANPCPRT